MLNETMLVYIFIHSSVHLLIHGLNACMWPMSLHFFTLVSFQVIRTGSGTGISPVLLSIPFPFAFHISVFLHSLFSTCQWISFVYFQRAVSAPRPLHSGVGPAQGHSELCIHKCVYTLALVKI